MEIEVQMSMEKILNQIHKYLNMKVLSIIGIVWFVFTLIGMYYSADLEESFGWGFLGLSYALALAISGLVDSLKTNNSEIENNINQELLELFELKEKGVLSESEYQGRKNYLLRI